MKLTSWNIRGLGSKRKQRNLSNKIKEEKLDMVFIQETKCSVDKIRELHSKWIYNYKFHEVKAINTVGGILTLWNPQKFEIIDAEATRNHLSMVIQPLGDKECYLITNVYGTQILEEKLKLLTSLEELRERHSIIPWIMGGDFNMIKSLSKKKGGSRMLGRNSLAFQNFIDNMRLVSMETTNDTLN